jgi:hypothetical protein
MITVIFDDLVCDERHLVLVVEPHDLFHVIRATTHQIEESLVALVVEPLVVLVIMALVVGSGVQVNTDLLAIPVA